MTVFIYGLRDPIADVYRYVGITKNIQRRFSDHINAHTANPAKREWVLELREKGLLPIIEILEEVSSYAEAGVKEAEWIRKISQDQDLTNIRRGNDFRPRGETTYNLDRQQLLSAMDSRKSGMTISAIATKFGVTRDYISRVFKGYYRADVLEEWEKMNGELYRTPFQNTFSFEDKYRFFELHFLENKSVPEIAEQLLVSLPFIRSVLDGDKNPEVRAKWLSLNPGTFERRLEKQDIPIRDDQGFSFLSIQEAAKFYSTTPHLIIRSITANRPSPGLGIQFFYFNSSITSYNKIKGETYEEERARHLKWSEAGHEKMAELRQDQEWEKARIEAIKDGIKPGQRSVTQTEQMKDPQKRKQISQTMTGRKYDKPRRTRSIRCSRGIVHESTLKAAEYYGLHPNSILKVLKGLRKTNEVDTKDYGKVSFVYEDAKK